MGNVAKISGTVIAEPEYSHTTVGEKFYKVLIEVARMSGAYDEVPCIVPEIFAQKIRKGQRVHFDGEVRTYYSKDRHLASIMKSARTRWNCQSAQNRRLNEVLKVYQVGT